MQSSDLDKYETDLFNFLNIDVTVTTPETIQASITEIETNRQTVLSSQNATEARDNIISVLQNEDFNKIQLYGTLCKSYHEYSNKIANEPDIVLKTVLIEHKQALQGVICGAINNDDYLINLFNLIKFMNSRSC